MNLPADIDQAFRDHSEKDNALIVGRDRLKKKILTVVQTWLRREEEEYREAGKGAVADALRDLRVNLTTGY